MGDDGEWIMISDGDFVDNVGFEIDGVWYDDYEDYLNRNDFNDYWTMGADGEWSFNELSFDDVVHND